MKIALYLGSFDPFHKGHYKVVLQAKKDFKMDCVIIVPTMHNPFKKNSPLDIDERIHLINLSFIVLSPITGHPIYTGFWDFVEIDDIEKSLIPPYYSYATLHALKNKYCNDEIFILCGEDTIEDIPNWMHGEQILKDYDFLVCDRTEESSTEVRNRVKNGESIKGLVSDNIIRTIEYLYGNKSSREKTKKSDLS